MSFQIPWAKPMFSPRDREYVLDALDSTWISGGPYVNRLEKEFTQLNHAKYGIAISNGTTALHLPLLALGIGPGDEVIVPGFTFVAPVNMVIAVGATPVVADIDPYSWCIDVNSVIDKITSKTKAIIAVHTYGNVCDMTALLNVAEEYGIYIIEDTAEAAFSKYNGQYAGTFGIAGCFSFHATKTITTGEGGFVVTDNQQLYEKMRLIRDHGMNKNKRYWHEAVGFNFRMTNMQAALGCSQLLRLEEVLKLRRQMDRVYRNLLSGISGLTFQYYSDQVDPTVWAVAVKIHPDEFGANRDKLMSYLNEAGIETRPGFYPIHQLPIYNAAFLPVADDVGCNVISLPSFPSITQKEITYICDKIKELRYREI